MRRIKKAKITHISLVPRGANRLPVIYKSDDSTVDFDTIIKADMEQGEITAIVYAAEHRDSQGDIASARVIKEAAHEFAKTGEGVDIRHDGKAVPKDAAYVAENYIVKKGDPDFADLKDRDGNPVDATGAWAVVIKVDDPELRKAYREGKWDGVSMGGTGVLEMEKSDDGLIHKLIKAITSLGKDGDQGDSDMSIKPEEFQAMLDKQVEALAKILKPEKPDEKKVEKEDGDGIKMPVFKGDISKQEDLDAYKREILVAKAQHEHKDDPIALVDALSKINADFAEDTDALDKEAGVNKTDTAEVKALKRQLAKELKKSNQKTGDTEFLGKSEEEVADTLADEILKTLPEHARIK